MEYVQEHVATLHDFDRGRCDADHDRWDAGHVPDAPLDRTAVVVPLTERDRATPAAERTFAALAAADPARVVVALRASSERVAATQEWLAGFDLPLELLWCGGPRLDDLLDESGLDGAAGKGRDVWLALGLAADAPLVVVHDADARTFSPGHVARLCAPLADGFGGHRAGAGESSASDGYAFVKGYYARVERNRLYGRLFRLFYTPLVRALDERHDAPILDYLASFRYALAGEFALTGALARRFRVQRGWGLEVGTLGEAFRQVGFDRTAQVDLGVHEHDHRSVSAPAGLAEMSRGVGTALFRAVEDAGVVPEYDMLAGRYRGVATRLVDQYAADAAFNALDYDPAAEREQIDAYADAVTSPGPDTRLPAWTDAALDPEDVRAAAHADLDAIKD